LGKGDAQWKRRQLNLKILKELKIIYTKKKTNLFFAFFIYLIEKNKINLITSTNKRFIKMKEIVNLHIGQAGVQLGNSFWELFCLEHGIQPDGVMPEKHQDDQSYKTFFFETKEGKFTPRSLFFDLDPSVIDEIRTGIYRNLHHSENLFTGKEDASSIYARGMYTVGKVYIDQVLAKIRNLVEKCENFQGFIISHALGGGTGSGFANLLTGRLIIDYGSKSIHNYCVLPFQKKSSPLEPYNVLHALYHIFEQNDVPFFFDNESLYEICKNDLEIESPRYRTINRMIAQAVSNITSGLRFDGSLNCNLKEIETNLIPFPKVKGIITSYAPFRSMEKAHHEYMSVANMTNKLFIRESMMVNCDMSYGKLFAGCLIYRGDVSPKEVHSAVINLKKDKTIQFADCSSNSFKIGINFQNPISVPGGDIAKTSRSCTFLGNSSAFMEIVDRFNSQFDKLYAKRGFVHWYVGEGEDEAEFSEAREGMEELRKLYEELSKDDNEEENGNQGNREENNNKQLELAGAPQLGAPQLQKNNLN